MRRNALGSTSGVASRSSASRHATFEPDTGVHKGWLSRDVPRSDGDPSASTTRAPLASLDTGKLPLTSTGNQIGYPPGIQVMAGAKDVMGSESSATLRCMYTNQKTKKRKVWSDGAVKCYRTGGRICLYRWSDVLGVTDKLLGESYLSVQEFEAFVSGAEPELEMEQFIVSFDGIIEVDTNPSSTKADGGHPGGTVPIGRKRKQLKPFKPPARKPTPVAPPVPTYDSRVERADLRHYPAANDRVAADHGLPHRTTFTGFGHVESLWGEEAGIDGPTSSSLPSPGDGRTTLAIADSYANRGALSATTGPAISSLQADDRVSGYDSRFSDQRDRPGHLGAQFGSRVAEHAAWSEGLDGESSRHCTSSGQSRRDDRAIWPERGNGSGKAQAGVFEDAQVVSNMRHAAYEGRGSRVDESDRGRSSGRGDGADMNDTLDHWRPAAQGQSGEVEMRSTQDILSLFGDAEDRLAKGARSDGSGKGEHGNTASVACRLSDDDVAATAPRILNEGENVQQEAGTSACLGISGRRAADMRRTQKAARPSSDGGSGPAPLSGDARRASDWSCQVCGVSGSDDAPSCRVCGVRRHSASHDEEDGSKPRRRQGEEEYATHCEQSRIADTTASASEDAGSDDDQRARSALRESYGPGESGAGCETSRCLRTEGGRHELQGDDVRPAEARKGQDSRSELSGQSVEGQPAGGSAGLTQTAIGRLTGTAARMHMDLGSSSDSDNSS